MSHGLKIKKAFTESRIVRFFACFNKNLLLYFYNSGIYKLFVKIKVFFRSAVLKNADESVIIKSTRKVLQEVKLRDIGWFIILVVLFNTLAMVFLGKEIDVFSTAARVFFFALGVILIVRKKQ